MKRRTSSSKASGETGRHVSNCQLLKTVQEKLFAASLLKPIKGIQSSCAGNASGQGDQSAIVERYTPQELADKGVHTVKTQQDL